MTSAPSRPRPLSGNKYRLILFSLCFSLTACGIFGPKGPGTGDPTSQGPVTKTEEKVVVKVDTITLRDVTKESLPPITDVKIETIESEMKSSYDVAMLFPFNAIRYQNIGSAPDSKGKRFIQYYGGARIAIDDLMSEGKRLNIHTYDTEESESKVKSLLNDYYVKEADLIVGPYRPGNLELVANVAKENNIPCASPWVPGFELKEDNPYLIHMTPGLPAHAEAIFSHIESHFSNPDVYVIVRNRPNELKRLIIFKNAYQRVSSEPDSLKELIFDDNTSDLQNTDLLHVMEDPSQAIFVVPYYSRSDEGFINSVLRKLHAERFADEEKNLIEKDVVVFGMPQWLNFRELNYDYLESLKAHVSTISFSDRNHPKYDNFKSRYLDRYGIVPDPAAFQGYDLVYYLGTMLHEKGTGFLSDLENGLTSPMNLGLDLQPIYRTSQLDRDEMELPRYYENRGIRILEFRDLRFNEIR